MKIKRIPVVDKTNGWSGVLTQRSSKPSLSGEHHADWIVLGAGYAGLASARRLAQNRPNEKIALIDAGSAGENASGRNSGFAIDLPHNVGSSLDELDGSHRFMRLARFAISHLDEQVNQHNINCDWSKDGRYHAAVSNKGVKAVLESYARELEALNEPFEWLSGDALQQKVGTKHFTAAVFTPGGALMNPAALTRGLADSLPDNVTLYENSPVVAMKSRNGIQLSTHDGELRAPKMILAANGYSEQFGYYPNKFLHLVAWGSLTRPLTEQEQAAYAVDTSWGINTGQCVCWYYHALHKR